MKARARLVAVPAGLTLLLAFILFVPVVQSPGGGTMTECNQSSCVTGIQRLESISYAYGGFGAVFQTHIDWFAVQEWACSCPAQIVGQPPGPCCVLPYSWFIWPLLWLLVGADLVSAVVLSVVALARRGTRAGRS